MISLEPGVNVLEFANIQGDPDAERIWADLVGQASKIALSYPHHFFSRVAREIIPLDAKRHRLFCYLDRDLRVSAFAVVSVVTTTAEIVWLACAKSCQRQKISSVLLTSIEELLFSSENVKALQVLCCSEDTHYTVGEETIDGKEWHGTYAFYRSLGYGLHCRLDHYWGDFSHAYLFMKRKGFEKFDFLANPKKYSANLSSLNQSIHFDTIPHQICHYIWNCLDAFDERFVAGIGVTAGTTMNTEGITGIILGTLSSSWCTIFAQRSTEPLPYMKDMRFQFEVAASNLTSSLVSCEGDQGVMHYPGSFDSDSEIQLMQYFTNTGEVECQVDGCYVFYKRHQRADGGFSIIYFATPSVRSEDMVWCLHQWSILADYSVYLALEILQYLLALQVTRADLRESDYFQGLIRSVTPDEKSGPFAAKVKESQSELRSLMTDHYNVIVRSKDSAIIHYGHTLGHRLSPIKAYFEGNKDSLKRAIANAKFLDDLSVVLQAINLASTEELYRHPKKSRFLKYAREDGSLNIAEKIRNEWPMLAESFQPTTLEGDETSQMRVMVLIQFSGCLPDSHLDYMLVDSVNGEACRPCEAFYSQLFSELLLNVVRYGVIPKDEFDLAAKQGHVLVELAFQDVSCGDRTLPCIVMSNLIGKKSPPPWLRKTCWTPWPSDRENDGPGMAIAVLRRLGLGEMYYRYEPTYRLFDVAVWLRGIRTKET